MTAEVKQEAQAATTPPADKEINFEKLRKTLEQERSARLAAEEQVKKIQQEQQGRSKYAYKDEDEDYTDEPYVDHKFLNRKIAKWEQTLEEKFEKKAEEKARQLLEQEKQQNYVRSNPDFHNVLTSENVQKFAESHPAIAERMLRMPDTFDRQALLYEQIKAFNAVKAKESETASIQAKIDQNRKSPFYQPSGVGSAPYASAGDYSPTGQKNAYAKLQELKAKLRI